MTKPARCPFPPRTVGQRLLPWLACALATPAGAGQGLVPAASEWLWPRVQARITVQTAALTPVTLARLGDSASGLRSVQGGSLLGDYVFATPNFGNFRATSGVMFGAPAGAPVLHTKPMSRLGVTVLDNGTGGHGAGAADAPTTLPYLGFGYSSAALWRSLSVSADVGLVAGRPAGLSGVGRAMFGNQPMDAALRELRLAPVLQLGMRYSF